MPKEKIQLWHQDVDADNPLMDWPVTPAYVRAFAQAFGVRILFQHRIGGFYDEMMRENSFTKPTRFELQAGGFAEVGGKSGKKSTRRKFPQVSADLRVRWCSAYLKIDVAARAINNDPELQDKKILFVTGERRQESTARSKYREVEPHRCHNNSTRHVDQWRAVIDWSEQDVWDVLQQRRVRVHPAYYLGWGRVSCMTCIFADADQWASVREIAPGRLAQIHELEQEFGLTIKQGESVAAQANRGESFIEAGDAELIATALGTEYDHRRIILDPDETWELPRGAFKRCGGPT